MFVKAFPSAGDPVTVANVAKAIATFERTIISANAPYDRYTRGETTALSESAQRGMELFYSERLECFHCHGGFNFTDSTRHGEYDPTALPYHNTGLYDVDGKGAYPKGNAGVYDVSGAARDMGKFRAPTLRNIAITAPYMHDGSIATLGDVIDHYAAGGRAHSSLTSEFLPGFVITPAEKADVIAFLESLTDKSVLTDPSLGPP
jgi:cytochrome c peroxidase